MKDILTIFRGIVIGTLLVIAVFAYISNPTLKQHLNKLNSEDDGKYNRSLGVTINTYHMFNTEKINLFVCSLTKDTETGELLTFGIANHIF